MGDVSLPCKAEWTPEQHRPSVSKEPPCTAIQGPTRDAHKPQPRARVKSDLRELRARVYLVLWRVAQRPERDVCRIVRRTALSYATSGGSRARDVGGDSEFADADIRR
jgi:hypothetical protein